MSDLHEDWMGEDDAYGDGAEAAALAQRLLCDETVEAKHITDPALRDEIDRRLGQVGFRLTQSGGRLYAHAEALNEGAGGYSEPQLAALAQLASDLLIAPAPGPGTPNVTVADFHARFAAAQGWSKQWVRRAVLGPLERDGHIRVVAPGQRRTDEYIQAGPRLALIDTARLARALGAAIERDEAAA